MPVCASCSRKFPPERGEHVAEGANLFCQSAAKKEQPIPKHFDGCVRDLREDAHLFRAAEPAKAPPRLDHPGGLRWRKAQPVDQDLLRYVVDVDQAAVVELARQVGMADAQLPSQRRIARHDGPRLLAQLAVRERGGSRSKR